MPADKRFIYHAHGVGVAAKVFAIQDFWASCALPVIGGRGVVKSGPVTHTFFQFDEAQTVAEGGVNSAGQVQWTVETTVTNLRVLDMLRAAQIQVAMKFTFDSNNNKLMNVGLTPKPFSGLVIGNDTYDDVAFEAPIADQAGNNHRTFRQNLPTLRPGAYHVHPRLNTAYASLAKDPRNRLRSDQTEHGCLDVAGFGSVYFGEWSEDEDQQSITGLRIVLHQSPPTGELVFGAAQGNGQFYP